MPTASPLQRVAFTATSTVKFVSAALRAGILTPEGGHKSMTGLLPVLARYRFTTAREVEQANNTVPERNALIDDDGVLTYGQLADRSKAVARWLLQLKADRGLDELRIGIMARNGRGIIVPMTAKGYSGGQLFLLNVGSSPEQLEGCFEENNINVLFIDDEFAERLPASSDITVVWAHTAADHGEELTLETISRQPVDHLPRLPLFPKHGNIVLMSSGTSGVPKGILRPEPIFPFVVAGYLDTVKWRIGMTIQLTASMFHTWGWSAVNVAFAARNTIITHRVFDPEKVFREIQDFRCDGLVSSPIFFKRMLEVPDNRAYDTSSLTFIASAGNALTPLMVERMTERFGPILANYYGSTELALAACADAELLVTNPTIAGRIPPGTTLKLFDDNGNEVPQGHVGRIFLRNETALKGYSNPNTKIVEIDGLIEMGDLGFFDERGFLHVLSRNDDMIIVGGENVHPQSVTEVLERMPGINELHSGGVDDDVWFKRIAVWVVRENNEAGRALTADAIRDWVREKLADHSVPRDVNFVDKLPRNATGKVIARDLPPSTRKD
ncbi:Long-chain-fatty-acid--CoA ligase [Corynebacterium capitovis DSM 44611]|uniref:AMP-binding protein n=1 Tax=Corynebacterium capitovis TaxID=131081 RepID=UPI000366B8A4|nr:AMP-binding protein [Corynebacterium capitovis]WKD56737.1 Long-chain-fatty-acid--CoA ligase [Corynebacterium capitovis DSM 44611]